MNRSMPAERVATGRRFPRCDEPDAAFDEPETDEREADRPLLAQTVLEDSEGMVISRSARPHPGTIPLVRASQP